MYAHPALAVLRLTDATLSISSTLLTGHQGVGVRLIRTFVHRKPLFYFRPSKKKVFVLSVNIFTLIVSIYLWEIFFLRMLLLRACMGCCASEAFLLRFVMAHMTKVSTPLKKWNHLLIPALNRIYNEWEAKVENSIWQCYQTRIKIQQRKHFRLMG